MQPQTIIFFGPQGSGKGTQADKITEYLQDTEQGVLYVEVGDMFRKLSELDSITGRRVRESMQQGDIQPAFLATSLWADAFAGDLTEQMHLVIDGSPRTLLEAKLLDEALRFYNRRPVTVIHLTLPEEETYKRLEDRGRSDDYQQAIARRLQEYKDKTRPVLDFHKDSPDYNYVQIDGQQSIAEIHQIIRSAIT